MYYSSVNIMHEHTKEATTMPIRKIAWKCWILQFCLAMCFAVLDAATPTNAFELQSHKNKLFGYRKPLEVLDGGNFLRLPYDPLKDINKRDEIPVRKVKGYYVSSRPKRFEQDTAVPGNGKMLTHFAVGALSGNSNMTVIFLHGRDGSRHLGFDDERFGGNFNRIKNLMFRSGGIYISADFENFEKEGKKDIAALVAHYRPLTNGKLVIACGSMGTFICWQLARDPKASRMIDGYIIMGGFPDPKYLESGKVPKYPARSPIYFAHGSIDSAYSWKDTHRYYQTLRNLDPAIPARYVLFDNGKHGTPVRMIDWRDALNWIASMR